MLNRFSLLGENVSRNIPLQNTELQTTYKGMRGKWNMKEKYDNDEYNASK